MLNNNVILEISQTISNLRYYLIYTYVSVFKQIHEYFCKLIDYQLIQCRVKKNYFFFSGQYLSIIY